MSGTAYGTVILHVAPEAAIGGPLALVRDGDMIELDVTGRAAAPRRVGRGTGSPPGGLAASRAARYSGLRQPLYRPRDAGRQRR